jgi:peroxiredoxin
MRIITALFISTLMLTCHGLRAEADPAPDAADAPDAAAAEAAAADAGLREQLGIIMQDVIAKYRAGQSSLSDYEPLFDRLDALYEKTGSNYEMRGMILGAKGGIYHNILNDLDTALQQYNKIVEDCAGTSVAENAAKIIAQIKLQESLVTGGEFPVFSFTGLKGESINLEDYRGKVVLVDFWATWCPPCIAELPHVLATYKKYHDKGFEIIGISLDKDKAKLESFIAEKEMAWPQYFDGKGWDNELSNRYAVSSIPATFLLGPDGKIIATSLRGDQLEKLVGAAIEAL